MDQTKTYPKFSTLPRRYSELHPRKQRELRMLCESDRLQRPIKKGQFHNVIKYPISKLKTEPLERLQLFAEFFDCSIEELFTLNENES